MRLQIETEQIVEFCRRRKITEFAIFGSALREDFLPESGVDVLVTFDPGERNVDTQHPLHNRWASVGVHIPL